MPTTETHRIAIILYPGIQILDVAGPVEIFKSVDQYYARKDPGGPEAYDITFLAEEAGEVMSTCGMPVIADASYKTYRGPIDTLLVSGGDGVFPIAKDRDLIDAIVRMASRSKRVMSICSGAMLLAESGLLNGRRATSHWAICKMMSRNFPDIEIDSDAIWVKDDNVYTSAGVTAGMDLSLAIVTEDHGRDVALSIARMKVMYMVRAGGQSQFSAALLAQTAATGRTSKLAAEIAADPSKDWRLPVMAAQAHMSERTFSRVFAKEMGMTPAKYVETARLDAARRMLEDGGKTIETVAYEAGFGDAERLRRAFHRRLGLGPAAYRNRFAAPTRPQYMENHS